MHSVYIVFSTTNNRIAHLIRWVTGEVYNHSSIALDEDLGRMYSFARRYHHTPLYGGFVKESLSRYHQNGKPANIRVCRLSVTREQYETLETLLTEMFENREHYLYNHLSALGAIFHRRVKARDAYTCIEFCVKILRTLGVELDPQRYYSVGQVEQLLRPYAIYTGPIPEETYDKEFYNKRPVPFPLWVTLRDMFKLLPRLGA